PGRSASGCANTGAVGEDVLVVAQESRGLDGAGSRAMGAIERQTVGDGAGVCDAAAIATSVCGSHGASGAEPVPALVRLGAPGSGSHDIGVVGADAQSSGHGRAAPGRHPGTLEGRV